MGEEMQKQMVQIQNKVEKKLRPLLRDQFLCMANVLNDTLSEQDALQGQLTNCGQKVNNVQQDLDRAMQHFGSSMQQEMMQCQQRAQQAMEAGGSESDDFRTSEREKWLKKGKISKILYNLLYRHFSSMNRSL